MADDFPRRPKQFLHRHEIGLDAGEREQLAKASVLAGDEFEIFLELSGAGAHLLRVFARIAGAAAGKIPNPGVHRDAPRSELRRDIGRKR